MISLNPKVLEHSCKKRHLPLHTAAKHKQKPNSLEFLDVLHLLALQKKAFDNRSTPIYLVLKYLFKDGSLENLIHEDFLDAFEAKDKQNSK